MDYKSQNVLFRLCRVKFGLCAYLLEESNKSRIKFYIINASLTLSLLEGPDNLS